MHCSICKRELKLCNSNPCAEKMKKQKQRYHAPKFPKAKETILEAYIPDHQGSLMEDNNFIIINEHTGQPQMDLIYFLNSATKLVGKAHWVTVNGYDARGMIVEMTINTPFKQWHLHDLIIYWFDFPWEVNNWPLDKRIDISNARLPVGSLFKAVVTEITETNMRLIPSKYASPILKLSPLSVPINSVKCPFRYLIAVDLEATCDYCPDPKVDSNSAEIIEFPWIVIDTKTMSIIDEQQIYVKPDNMEGITYYTTKLTGISKATVREAPNLATAIKTFEEYVNKKFGSSKSFRIVTDGLWDLQVQLRKEAEKKEIALEWYFKEYFDIKDEFRKFLPWFPESFKPRLDTTLKALGLDFVGKPHVGLDDSRNIAQIIINLLILGHSFNNPKKIPANYNSDIDPNFVDFGSVTEPNAWKCINITCAVWNRPWMDKCRFCQASKESNEDAQKKQHKSKIPSFSPNKYPPYNHPTHTHMIPHPLYQTIPFFPIEHYMNPPQKFIHNNIQRSYNQQYQRNFRPKHVDSQEEITNANIQRKILRKEETNSITNVDKTKLTSH